MDEGWIHRSDLKADMAPAVQGETARKGEALEDMWARLAAQACAAADHGDSRHLPTQARD